MTNFEHIKNMDIDTLAMMIAMDRQRIIEELAKALNVTFDIPEDFLYNNFSALAKYLKEECE